MSDSPSLLTLPRLVLVVGGAAAQAFADIGTTDGRYLMWIDASATALAVLLMLGDSKDAPSELRRLLIALLVLVILLVVLALWAQTARSIRNDPNEWLRISIPAVSFAIKIALLYAMYYPRQSHSSTRSSIAVQGKKKAAIRFDLGSGATTTTFLPTRGVEGVTNKGTIAQPMTFERRSSGGNRGPVGARQFAGIRNALRPTPVQLTRSQLNQQIEKIINKITESNQSVARHLKVHNELKKLHKLTPWKALSAMLIYEATKNIDYAKEEKRYLTEDELKNVINSELPEAQPSLIEPRPQLTTDAPSGREYTLLGAADSYNETIDGVEKMVNKMFKDVDNPWEKWGRVRSEYLNPAVAFGRELEEAAKNEIKAAAKRAQQYVTWRDKKR